jgi:hypothetical protein
MVGSASGVVVYGLMGIHQHQQQQLSTLAVNVHLRYLIPAAAVDCPDAGGKRLLAHWAS